MPFSATPGGKNALLSVFPATQSLPAGVNATMSVAATGPGPFSYQWSFNGSPIDGATNSSLTLSGITAANDGSYLCVVTSAPVVAASQAASLVVRLSYAQWAALNKVGGEQADPDGDGLNNLTECFII